LDLVKILSHPSSDNTSNDQNFGTSKVQGHALTIKDEFLGYLIDICIGVTTSGFLENNQDSFLVSLDTKDKLFILDEELLFKAINGSEIKNWEEFEFLLGFILENRLLQLYQSFLDSEHKSKWKKIDQDLLGYELSDPSQKVTLKPKSKNHKKPKNKKKNK
jgi:hypothetical protein